MTIKRKEELEVLNKNYKKNKIIPYEFEYPILKALSYYPELKEESIEFRYTQSKLPYFSRPKIITLLPFIKRKYLIGISIKSTDLREPTLLSNLSIKAQIGAIGHELAHISYYKKTSSLRIFLDGICYLNTNFKSRFEKMTDEIAIQHGLGDEIHSWAKEVFPVKKIDGNRSEIYYSPEQISGLITK